MRRGRWGALVRRLEPVYDTLTDLCSHFHAVLDYPDEDIDEFRLTAYAGSLASAQATLEALLATVARGQVLRQGPAVILGKPNVGKVQFAECPRPVPGHCDGASRHHSGIRWRTVLVGSVRLRLVDTAGIRDASDQVGGSGSGPLPWEAARGRIRPCWSVTAAAPWSRRTRRPWRPPGWPGMPFACSLSRTFPCQVDRSCLPFETVLPVSAKTGQGWRP